MVDVTAVDDFDDDDNEADAAVEGEEASADDDDVGDDDVDNDRGEDGLSADFCIDSFVADFPPDSFASLSLGEALLPLLELSAAAAGSVSEASSACCSKVLKQFLHSDFLHA